MATLLLRLAGPMQSWGSESKFGTRRTELYPTKSGVIGMLAAALGMKRDESLEQFHSLKFGVRIDAPGKVIKDFHTARKNEKVSYITDRYYLNDAIFLVGLESDDIDFLELLENALKNPVYPIFLGRRSCPPSLPLVLGIFSESLKDALEHTTWQVAEWRKKKENNNLRIVLESTDKATRIIKDEPITFHPAKRELGYRRVYDYVFEIKKRDVVQEHDPFAELEE
jgi:CRISPR system Cascade subunit CasD